MADVLTFDPATEFQIIETFDFEEEVQRPEDQRFFTLDEQLLDYFEARLPKGKRTRFEMKALADEVDRMREAYMSVVELTDTDYAVRQHRTARMPRWIRPLFDNFTYKTFDFQQQWAALYTPEQRNIPGGYTRILLSLPTPYQTGATENPHITDAVIGETDAGRLVHGLGTYVRTKSVIHEDGSRDIASVPIPNTQDDLRMKGYVLHERGIDIPNPLNGHPFFESVEPSKITTAEPFADVYPSVEAILTHGVPVTNDPYGEGAKYLRVYDVKLQEIPWSSWKSRFPVVDTLLEPPPPVSVKFPPSNDSWAPADVLKSVYTRWNPAVNPRFWLMQQADGGRLVARMLLSKAGDAGLVSVKPVDEIMEPQLPLSTPEECLVTAAFDSFLESGVYRAGRCVPVGVIQQERNARVSAKRQVWREGTEQDVLKTHMELLAAYQHPPIATAPTRYAAQPAKDQAELRRAVVSILKSHNRTDDDKADAIEDIVREMLPENSLFMDVDANFVVCEHTIAKLRGDLETDMLEFYRTWTAVDQGVRVCKHCGEQVGEVLVAQQEFDEDGHLVESHAPLATPVFRGETTQDVFQTALHKIQPAFRLDNAGEAVLFLVLSFLQVIPSESQFIPVLEFIRKTSNALRSAPKKVAEDTMNRIVGVLGLVGGVILMQTHTPFLVPRRSVGVRRKMVLSGFPRDTSDSEKRGVLDTIMTVLKAKFESFPGTFQGATVPFIRGLISKPGEIRKEAVRALDRVSKQDFKSQFESARVRITELPQADAYALNETLPQQGTHVKPVCSALRILKGKLPPNITQTPVRLRSGIAVPEHATPLDVAPPAMQPAVTFADAEIRERVGIGFPSTEFPKLKAFIAETDDGLTLLALLSRLIDITVKMLPPATARSLHKAVIHTNMLQNPSLLRDIARGFLYVFFKSADEYVKREVQDALKKDVVLRMLMMTTAEAESSDQGLRAKERETLKQRLRNMSDSEREITKKLLDIGLAPFIITNADREIFARQAGVRDPEGETAEREQAADENLPEDGHNAERDYVDNGDQPVNDEGAAMEVDYGDYGDRGVRDYNDYAGENPYDGEDGI
jgi:hypothetical protein